MPQISFTPRNSDVYDRFSELMMQYQLDHKCKLTAPQFLDLVLDAFELLEECETMNKAEQENPTKSIVSHIGTEVTYCVKYLDGKPTLYRVEEWEREGSIWEPQNETE